MKLTTKLWAKVYSILPPNFPTDLAEAFDGAKRSFWKAAAPAELAKEKITRTYLERVIAELNDRIETLEEVEPGSELDITRKTMQTFRKRIDEMQYRIAELESENQSLREQLGK